MESELVGWRVRTGGFGDKQVSSSTPARLTLGQIMERSYVAVHRFARLQLDLQDAEDVTAEVFAVALRRLPDIPADPDRAHAWVMAAARRVTWSQIRSIQRRRALLIRLGSQPRPTAVDPTDRHADLVVIQRAIARLGRRDRDVIGLLVVGDLDRDGVAEALGCSVATAGVRIHRARQRLRQALEAEERAADEPGPTDREAGR